MFSTKVLVVSASAMYFALIAPARAQNSGDSDAAGAQAVVMESASVIRRMDANPHFNDLLQKAKGVFVVPDLVKGALIVGAAGGEGALVARIDSHWSGPAFLSIGSISVGAQAGFEAGPLVVFLMSDKALADFTRNVSFAFKGDANLTVVSWSPDAEAAIAGADVVIWAGENGLFAGLDVTGSEAHATTGYNKAYYDDKFTQTRKIIESPAEDASSNPLLSELPG